MDVVYPACCGVDVHKQTVVACLLRTDAGSRRTKEVRTFGTTTEALLALGDWLESHGVTHVAMESTGVYWKPVWHILEGAFELVLGKARQMRNVPGRKSDQSDASWFSDLQAHGLIRNSFVPPQPIQDLRDLTRTRKQLVREKAQHVQRIQKVLEDANIKLTSVLSDIQGLSGRTILDAITNGITDPHQLAKLAHPQVKAPREKIVEALEGKVTEHHRFMLRLHLQQMDALQRAIGALESRIEEKLSSFREIAELISTIPGLAGTVTATIIAETGGDMSAFPSDDHLVSWAGLSPGLNETGGKRKSARTRPQRWLKTAMVQAAQAAVKKKDSYLRSKYHRIKARRGSKKAILAIAAALLRATYHVVTTRVPYRDLGPDYFDARDRQRSMRRLVRRLEALGYQVDLKAAA